MPDLTTLSARWQTMLTLGAIFAAVVGGYYNTVAKMDTTTAAVVMLRAENEARHLRLTVMIDTLQQQVTSQRDEIIVLRTTLRVKGVLQ